MHDDEQEQGTVVTPDGRLVPPQTDDHPDPDPLWTPSSFAVVESAEKCPQTRGRFLHAYKTNDFLSLFDEVVSEQ